jgi:4'-phosphopantetheinyl transferase
MPTPAPPVSALHPAPAPGEIPLAGTLQAFALQRQEACYTGRFAAIGVAAYGLLQPCAAGILHAEEMRYFLPLPAERRRVSFLLGRYAAKRALRPCLGDPAFAAINIAPGVFKNPVVCYPMPEPWQVSITHSDSLVCALAFPQVHPMALDVELIDAEKLPAMVTQCQDSERAEASRHGLDAPTAATLLWTAKEALSKVLHTGLMCPFNLFEIESIQSISGSMFQGFYKHLAQYKFQAWIRGNCILTITLPKRTELAFDTGQPRFPDQPPGPGGNDPAKILP